MVLLYHELLNHYPDVGNLGCFQYFAIQNLLQRSFSSVHLFALVSISPEAKLLAVHGSKHLYNFFPLQKWRSHRGLSKGEWEWERGEKAQRISSINGR